MALEIANLLETLQDTTRLDNRIKVIGILARSGQADLWRAKLDNSREV